MRSAALAILVSVAVSCGGDPPAPQPGIVYPDGSDRSDVSDGSDGSDGSDRSDGPALSDLSRAESREVEGSDRSDVSDSGRPSDVSDSSRPGLCTPGVVTCQGNKLVICNASGDAYDLIEKCKDDNPCTEDKCANGMCAFDRNAPNCCFPPCPLGQLCIGGQCACAPACLGKECGDDGCGGQCGECPEGFLCSLGGQCECIPKCEGKLCGDDGCGGQCGYCVAPESCVTGACVCVPQCAGKACGDDLCGGTCGACPALHQCAEGQCSFYCPTCPGIGNCDLAAFGGHAYYICKSAKTWGKAVGKCKDAGTHLVTVTSDAENAFVLGLAAGLSVWIGYYEEWFDWHWVNGEPKGYEAWGPEQPDDGSFWTIEDCTEIQPWGTWNDNECSAERWFVCEYEP